MHRFSFFLSFPLPFFHVSLSAWFIMAGSPLDADIYLLPLRSRVSREHIPFSFYRVRKSIAANDWTFLSRRNDWNELFRGESFEFSWKITTTISIGLIYWFLNVFSLIYFMPFVHACLLRNHIIYQIVAYSKGKKNVLSNKLLVLNLVEFGIKLCIDFELSV